jgi:polyisoprenoid-binding protein YceI
MNMKRISYGIAALLLLSLVSSNVVLAQKKSVANKLAVNTADSKVNWIGKKPTGEHSGYVKLSSGEILVENKEIKGGSFVIDLNTITDTDLKDEGMNAKLVGHLKSPDFFDVAKYSTAKFVITKVTKATGTAAGAPKATHTIEGDLTIKGITKKIRFDASINELNGKVTASTTPFTIDRTLWGVNYQSKSVFAELKDQFIYDDMTLSIDLVTQ